MSDRDLVVFCGPSLNRAEARKLFRGQLLAPARQGDVYRVLPRRPRAIALIDGLFESVPSVWHRELLAALDAGVAVFGASSMGALRAAELAPFGVVGIGKVFEWVMDGTVQDDAEVALLHADAEHDYRAMTVPLVTVRHACEQGRVAGVLQKKEAGSILAAAERIHYSQRTWRSVVEAAGLGVKRVGPVLAWLKDQAPDVKREDAVRCIEAAREFVASAGPGPMIAHVRAVPSHARHRQLVQTRSLVPGAEVAGAEVLAGLRQRADSDLLMRDGLRTLALAAHAKTLGMAVPAEELLAERQELVRALSGSPEELGLDDGQLLQMAEALWLERKMLQSAERIFPDGPSATEGLALGARLSGAWKEEARRAAPRRRTKPKRGK